MKKTLNHICFKSLVCVLFLAAAFQARTQSTCSVTIVGNFESRCLVTTDKPDPFEEFEGELIACQGATVIYSALSNTGEDPAVSWVWSVSGDFSWSNLGNGRISVVWGNGNVGQITVTVTTAGGESCTSTRNVRLIENPEVSSATVPAYTPVSNGVKHIIVCEGDDVEFIDQSTSPDKDIVGNYWLSSTTSSTTQNYTLHNVLHDDTVVHRVYNECGCYDEEVYYIKVYQGETLELECYGAACQNDIVTYTATSPVCNDYYWSVDGGTVVDGQYTKNLTVQWDRPQNGYGVISLDGVLCGEEACPSMLSKKIAVMHDGVPVDGKTLVCVGEGVVYSVPLFGSTKYDWEVLPSTGVTIDRMTGANQRHISFTFPGTYIIKVSYQCDFLYCGPFSSELLTVTVKQPLHITGRNKICAGNSCRLTTDAGVAADWTVYDLATGQQVESVTGQTTYIRAFANTGRYRIVAEHSSYCIPDEFILTVLPPPPAPTVADMDPDNPSTACTGSSILLKATPTNPDYTIVWQPDCSDATPGRVSGNSVTVNYDQTVCDVKVYNYDRKLECLSTGYYVHTVSEFELAQLSLPTSISVCPNAEIVYGSTAVPSQSGVLYRWEIDPDKQYCATAVGSALQYDVMIQVNEIPVPDNFDIRLIRTYCSELEDVHVIHVSVGTAVACTLSISSPSAVCEGEEVSLSGSGCAGGDYIWKVGGQTLYGQNVSWLATTRGATDVTLICSPFTFCDDDTYYSSATSTIVVKPVPLVTELRYNSNNNTVYCVPSNAGNTFLWKYNGNTISTGSTAPFSYSGEYTVEITNSNGCTTIYSQYVEDVDPPYTYCDYMNVTNTSFDYCNSILTVTVGNTYGNLVSWSVEGGNYQIVSTSGTYNTTAEIKLLSLGSYTITAYAGVDPCYKSEITYFVDFIPNFTFETKCNAITIHNNSRFYDGSKYVTISCNGINHSFQLSQSEYTIGNLFQGIYTFSLVGYDNNPISNCLLGSVNLVAIPHTLSITTENTENPTYTCDNIPIKLTASLDGTNAIQSAHWSFGDGSSTDRGNIVANKAEVYHTFKNNPNSYTVTVTVKDDVGCEFQGTISITSFMNNMLPGNIISSTGPICPNFLMPQELFFSVTPAPPAIYQWTSPLGQNSTYYVSHTDDYYLYVKDANFCQIRKMQNVGFLNAPEALIVTERTEYCKGEKVVLYGAPDPDTTNYTFLWTITPPYGADITINTATAFFDADQTGDYTVKLKIINSDGCSDIATRVIPVDNVPPAPTVTFGSNRCIDSPPVILIGSASATNEMQWSNGSKRHSARYYYPGYATAFYYDPATGCRSESGRILIDNQPDFDALLTGCYYRCQDLMTQLPVYGLTTELQQISWYWYYNNSVYSQASNVSYASPLVLPIPSYGNYNLDVDYQGNSCSVSSPDLQITYDRYCRCDSMEIRALATPHISDCIVTLVIDVSVINNSSTSRSVSTLSALFDNSYGVITSTTFTPQTIAPNSNYQFRIIVEMYQFLPSGAVFEIFDAQNLCTMEFTVNLMELVDCTGQLNLGYCVNMDMSNSAAAYLDLTANIAPLQNLLAFWSEPPMVVDYTFNSLTSLIAGLGMIDMAVLAQMVQAEESVCLYAVVCRNDTLCKLSYCIDAGKLLDALNSKEYHKVQDDFNAMPEDTSPRLVPNPTLGKVVVTDYNGVVTELVILDMNGRRMAVYSDTDRFDMSAMPSGMYIVRVRTKRSDAEENVHYMKLIKK